MRVIAEHSEGSLHSKGDRGTVRVIEVNSEGDSSTVKEIEIHSEGDRDTQ